MGGLGFRSILDFYSYFKVCCMALKEIKPFEALSERARHGGLQVSNAYVLAAIARFNFGCQYLYAHCSSLMKFCGMKFRGMSMCGMKSCVCHEFCLLIAHVG
jgi:hypothetical protein